MTTTKVSVCNEALSMLGAKTIQSFDDSTENARRCASIYDSTRKALLRMHPWSFAKKRTQLAPIATHPTFGYANAFPLPSDFVRLYDVGAQDFEIEGRHILANSGAVSLVYVFDNDNEQTWDTLFSECMALYLMHKLAKPITGSQSESDSAWQKLQNTLKQARAVNAQERPSQDFDANFSPTLIGVRF